MQIRNDLLDFEDSDSEDLNDLLKSGTDEASRIEENQNQYTIHDSQNMVIVEKESQTGAKHGDQQAFEGAETRGRNHGFLKSIGSDGKDIDPANLVELAQSFEKQDDTVIQMNGRSKSQV